MPTPPIAEIYDLAVIGGGINGVGIAADAAGRGLSVFLCERDDLAQHTSSASSKLIHGGLRYLEHYEFRLVREALAEREVLLAKAPHIVKPMRFILPHRPHLRPAWMIRAGLFLYDHLGKRENLSGSHGMRFGRRQPAEGGDAAEASNTPTAGSTMPAWCCSTPWPPASATRTSTPAPAASAHGAARACGTCTWNAPTAACSPPRARALVNAAGPWVAKFLQDDLKQKSPYGIRLIQGSHIVVPRLHDQASRPTSCRTRTSASSSSFPGWSASA